MQISSLRRGLFTQLTAEILQIAVGALVFPVLRLPSIVMNSNGMRSLTTWTKRQGLKAQIAEPPEVKSPAGEIEKLAKTSELLTGGATDRFDINDFTEWLRSMSPDERRKHLLDLKARSRDGGISG